MTKYGALIKIKKFLVPHATLFLKSRPMIKEYCLTDVHRLVKGCANNDPNAQKILFEAYARKMLGVCARYCPNIEDAKDAMHDGFIKVFKQLERFKGDSKLETWITRIMINTAIDQFKKSIRYKGFENNEDIYALSHEDYSEEIMVEDRNSNLQKLVELVQNLPDGYRIIFNLYAIEGYKHHEIAEELGISVGTSKSQLARARKLLQKLVRQEINFE